VNRRRYLPAFGIDVDARMAKSARQHGLEVEVATFEEGDPAGRRLDAVAAGQTWHWVDPAAGAAKAAQVLRADSPFSGQCQGMRTRGGGHDRRRCDARTGHSRRRPDPDAPFRTFAIAPEPLAQPQFAIARKNTARFRFDPDRRARLAAPFAWNQRSRDGRVTRSRRLCFATDGSARAGMPGCSRCAKAVAALKQDRRFPDATRR